MELASYIDISGIYARIYPDQTYLDQQLSNLYSVVARIVHDCLEAFDPIEPLQ